MNKVYLAIILLMAIGAVSRLMDPAFQYVMVADTISKLFRSRPDVIFKASDVIFGGSTMLHLYCRPLV